ncbi:MAG: hypothetical protein JNK92_05800 [Dechloromonas sp.]|nr:hypothetical protein [Dechloromonas sp.]
MFLSRILPYPRIVLTAIAILLAACAGTPGGDVAPERNAGGARSTASLRSGFACCNLRYSGDQLSSSNFAQLPFIAVGTPVLVRAVDDVQAIVEINGQQMLMRPDPAQTRESPGQWLDKAVVAQDPRRRLEAFPAGVRAAIQSSRVMKGMTREQVIMSIGYPQMDEKKGLEAPSWRYWWSGFESFYVKWTRDKVRKIDGDSATVNKLNYQ